MCEVWHYLGDSLCFIFLQN